jgi:hypothetical protein
VAIFLTLLHAVLPEKTHRSCSMPRGSGSLKNYAKPLSRATEIRTDAHGFVT